MPISINRRPRETDPYRFSFADTMPSVLTTGTFSRPDTLSGYAESGTCYRDALTESVSGQLTEIDQVLARYAPAPSGPLLGDYLTEAPDDVSYQDAYSWQTVKVSVRQVSDQHYSADPEVWQ